MDLAVSAGFEEVVNDPWIRHHGLRVGLALAPKPWVEVGLVGVAYPLSGSDPCEDADFTALACEFGVHWQPSRITAQGQAIARVLPVVGQVGHWTIWAGGHAGFAIVGFESTPWFPSPPLFGGPVVGASVEVEDGRFGVRARIEQLHYVVNDLSVTTEVMQRSIGAEVLYWIR